jgi:flagellin
VTSLLNRAITLATEASNGTLNSTQEGAANQEYQSILAEINNIGQTTTYNQEQVFNGKNVAIYTGDSSTAGSSVDNLYIRTLSSSSVGDTNGALSYSSGQGNVFIDLSSGGTTATAGDALVNATSSLTINYMATGAGGAVSQQTATISVGGATGFADTAQGMINAINAANLGVTASFTTASQAGTQAVAAGNASDTGIMITGTGSGVGSGATPGSVGTLALNTGEVGVGDTLSGTLTIMDSSGNAHTQALGGAGWDTLANIAATVNGAGYGITAAYSAAGTGSVTFTSASSKASITAASLADTTATATDTPTYTAATAYYTVGVSTPAIGANGIADAATAQAASSTFTTDTTGSGGVATMSYTDSAGVSLSGTDLLNQANAQSVLNKLNVAINDVSAMDGYIGSQINTLNSISEVMSTQQENVTSAQNAIQATDYASATSDMSKYEILSQTGIAALAQANTVQQEVLKLLQ